MKKILIVKIVVLTACLYILGFEPLVAFLIGLPAGFLDSLLSFIWDEAQKRAKVDY